MMRWTACLATACSLGLLLPPMPAGEKKPAEPTAAEKSLFELTNLERKKKDVPPLKLNATLCRIARQHAENMARQGKMEHTLDGKTASDRIRDAGYAFLRAGENIAVGNDAVTLPAIMKVWLESPKQRNNLLLAEFSETGVGIARDKAGQLYYTQLFARPKAD